MFILNSKRHIPDSKSTHHCNSELAWPTIGDCFFATPIFLFSSLGSVNVTIGFIVTFRLQKMIIVMTTVYIYTLSAAWSIVEDTGIYSI